MRTTVTFEPDVEHGLKRLMRERRLGMKAALNLALRQGLAATAKSTNEPAFKVSAKPMGLRAGIDPARLNSMADELELDAFSDLSQKLAHLRDTT